MVTRAPVDDRTGGKNSFSDRMHTIRARTESKECQRLDHSELENEDLNHDDAQGVNIFTKEGADKLDQDRSIDQSVNSDIFGMASFRIRSENK